MEAASVDEHHFAGRGRQGVRIRAGVELKQRIARAVVDENSQRRRRGRADRVFLGCIREDGQQRFDRGRPATPMT